MSHTAGTPSPVSPRGLFALSIALGLIYGLLEGAGLVALRFVPWAAAPLNGTSIDILWFDPLFYAALFGAIGAIVSALALVAPTRRWDTVLLFLAITAAFYFGVDLQDHRLSNTAAVILGAGLATQVTRWLTRRPRPWTETLRLSTGLLVATIVIVALASGGGSRLLERRRLSAVASGATMPNVLLLVIDTQRADHLSSYGYRRNTTPRLDQLAREGILFEQAHSASSWTLPSHASLMTGRLPHDHHAGDPRQPFLDSRLPTLADRYRDAGYATGAFIANTFWAGHAMGLGRGFLTYRDYMTTLRDTIRRPVAGRKFGWELGPRFGWRQLQQPSRADQINQQLTDWIDQLGTRPFFAFVNYMDVHGPYLGVPPYTTMFARANASTAPVLIAPTNDEEAAEATGRIRDSIDQYDGSLAYLDHEIGLLLDGLARRGLAERTIVVVTSDHGESFGEHGFVNHGNSLYLDQTHVPLILRFPGHVQQGVRRSEPVSLQSLPDTLLSLSGQRAEPLAAEPLPTSADGALPTAPVVTEVAQRRAVPQAWPAAHGWIRSTVTERWHFILSERGTRELFDRLADPREEHNLAGDADHAALVTGFEGMLRGLDVVRQ